MRERPVRSRPSVLDGTILVILMACGIGAWLIRPEAFIADDSYFYLVIARNLALNGEQTFTRLFPTTGVHPLWCYLLAVHDALVSHLNPALLWNIRTAIPLSVLLLACGMRNFKRVAETLRISTPALVGIPLVFLLVNMNLCSEAVLHYAALSVLTLIFVNGTTQKRWGWLVAGIACAMVFLARLDSVFFVAGSLFLFMRRSGGIPALIRAAAVFAVLVIPYLAANWLYFGGVVPVSGWMKSSFPSVSLKGLNLDQGLYASMLFGYRIVWGILPIVIASTALLMRRKSPARNRDLLRLYLFGSVLHFAYVALFVRSHSIWAWYYVVPAVLLALTVATWLPPGRIWRAALAGALVVAAAIILAKAVRPGSADAALWFPQIEGTRYLRENRIEGKTILVSDWPGYLAFRTDNRIVAADMLTANVPLYTRMRRAPDALHFLVAYCAELGRPIEYVIYAGNQWLVPDADFTSITYNDPRSYPRLVPIGRLEFPAPPVYTSGNRGFLVWKLPPRGRSMADHSP